VVVTVSVVPLIVHVPSGIAQLAFSVGGVLNPLVLSAKVNELPGAPLCDGFGTVTAGAPANVAVTEVFAEMLNMHVVLVLPLHAPPLQLVNVAPVFGTAVSVIAVPELNVLPVGDCAIVPGPLTAVVNSYWGGANVAVTDTLETIEKMQVGLVLLLHSPPDQFVKVAPVPGTAVRVISVPGGKVVPDGDWVMVPGPITLVVSVNPLKAAETVVFAVTTTLHVEFPPLPVHAPPQAVNVAPVFGTAVKFTVVLLAKEVPVGVCVIVPGPVTLVVNVYFVTVVTAVPVKFEEISAPPGPLIFKIAARAPRASGANVTVTVQAEPTGTGALHVLLAVKSPVFEPVIVTDETVIGPVPVEPFFSWNVSGEEEPTVVSGNRIGDGATRTGSGVGGGAAMAVPEMESVRVLTLVVSVSVPVNVPTSVGANFTVAMQFAAGATGAEHVFVTEKLGSPLTETLETVSGPYPWFVRPTGYVVDWPTWTGPPNPTDSPGLTHSTAVSTSAGEPLRT